MSKLVELEETMTNATLFAVNKERDRIVRSFVENGFDLTKVSLKSFERVIKDKLWLAWQNAFAMGYEDEVQFGGVDVDVAEFADGINVNELFDWLDDYADLIDTYRDNPTPKLKETIKERSKKFESISKEVKSLREATRKKFKTTANEESKKLLGDLDALTENINFINVDYKKLIIGRKKAETRSDILDAALVKELTVDTTTNTKTIDEERKRLLAERQLYYTNQRKQMLSVKSRQRSINKMEKDLRHLENIDTVGAKRKRLALQNSLLSEKKKLDLETKQLNALSDKFIAKTLKDRFSDKTAKNKIYREVLQRFQKDNLTNRANAISFLNQTDFGRVYLENRLDYIARIQSGREYDAIKKRLTESVKDQSDPIINNANETIIQRFFENMVEMRYNPELSVSVNSKTLKELSKINKPNLPLSNKRYEETINEIPNYIVNNRNILDTIYKKIKNAMYPDRLTFINTAKDILQNSQTNENGKYRLNEEQSRNFGFINKNEITKQTLQKYRNFTGAELKDHFASGIQRVFVTEIHAAHHLGRLTYYHLNDVKLVKWQLDDEKNIDAPCDRCLYAGNNNSRRFEGLLSYEAPSSWFEKKAKEVVNLSDSFDDIVTFAKDPIIYVNPLYAGRTDQDLKAIIKNQKAVIRQLQKNNIDVTEELQKLFVLEDELKNRINLVKQRVKDAKKIAKQATEEQNWIKKNPMKDPTVTKYKKDTPQSNILSQPTDSNKTEPTKPTQISQTKKNKNTSQKQSNNISQPNPTEKKPYKTVNISQLKGIYFFDELLTDVNLSIPRHPYCRCRIVRLPYNEEQTLLALLGGEETVASAVSTGLGAASSLTMEEMIAAKETTKENRQWWTGLGKGAAIGAGILGAGFMMWYFIKTLKTPNKVTQGIGRAVKKGLMSVEDVAKAKEIEKITQEPLSKMPSKRAVKKAIEEGRDLTEETIKRLKGQEEVVKVVEEINPTALPELRNDVLLEPELQKVEIAVTYQTEKNKLDVLKKTLKDPNKEHTTVLQKLGRFELEDGKEFLTELGEQLIGDKDEQKEVKKAIRDDIDNITYDLEHTQFVNLPETKKQEIFQGLKNYFDNLNEGEGFKVLNSKLTELDDVLNDITKNELFNIRNNDELRAIMRRNAKLMTPATYKKWKNKIEKVRNEIKQIDESLQYMRQYLPDEANELNVGKYVRNAIDEIVDNSSNVPLEVRGYKTLFDKYDDLMNKVEKVNRRLLNYRQQFSYESKTRGIVDDPFIDNLTGVKRDVALETAEKVLDSLKTVKPNERITVEKFSQINVDNVRYLANSYFEMLRNNPNWNKDLKALTIKATDLTNDAITKEIAKFILVKEYNTKLSNNPSVNQRQLNRMRQVLMILLRSHIKRLRNLEFAGRYEGAEFSWRNMTLREACNIVQSRYSSFSTISR